MMIKVYEYKGCGTCKKALKFLEGQSVDFKKIAIREQPPTANELKKMIKFYDGDFKKLFNTSGQDYRQLNLKEKVAEMTETEAVKLLSSNGNLVKRPFVLANSWGLVGFKEDQWKTMLKAHKA